MHYGFPAAREPLLMKLAGFGLACPRRLSAEEDLVRRCSLFVVTGLLSVVFAYEALAQQEFPNSAAGAREGFAYSEAGAADQVNLFNGNLLYQVPIGEGLAVGPNLRLAPILTYNSKTFQWWQVGFDQGNPPGQCQQMSYNEAFYPSGDRLIGLGWTLHFGKLVSYPPSYRWNLCYGASGGSPSGAATYTSQPVGMLSTFYAFIEPDGAAHEFYDRRAENCDIANAPTCDQGFDTNYARCWTREPASQEHCFVYTHDGSNLRMDPKDPAHGGVPTVYYPDGTIYVLGYEGGRYPTKNLDAWSRREFDYGYQGWATRSDQWNTTQVLDSFGNSYTVSYWGQSGTGTAHPLAAHSVPTNQWDAIPYRASLSADLYYQFNVSVDSVTDSIYTLYSPRISSVSVPTSKVDSQSPSGFASATYLLTPSTLPAGDVTAVRYRKLTGLSMPEGLSYGFSYFPAGQANGSHLMQSVTLPTGGTISYTWGGVTFYHRTPANCEDFPVGCDGFVEETGDAVSTRSAVRAILGQPAETSTTTWIRSYKSGGVCGVPGSDQYCQQRVDVFSPIGLATERPVSRTTFWHSDGLVNAALYGKPIRTDDYALGTGASISSSSVDAATAFRSTLFTWAFDDVSNGGNPGPKGVNHNTREQIRHVDWVGSGRYWELSHASWDGYGHWGSNTTKEYDGSTLRTLRQEDLEFLNSNHSQASPNDVWILDPVKARTVSRPSAGSDPPTTLPYKVPNLSTREEYGIDESTGFTCQRRVTDDVDARVHLTVWRTNSNPSSECSPVANGGFPLVEKATLTGSRTYPTSVEGSGTAVYIRRYTYSNHTLATAKDDGTSFFVLDRTVAPTGKPIQDTPPEGRDTFGTLLFSTAFEYDLLGRVVSTTPPEETTEKTTYSTSDSKQIQTSWKCASSTDCSLSSAMWMRRTFFDQLGRPTALLRRMPGTGTYSYQLSTFDEAGRLVSTSEWQSLTGCLDSDPCKTDLLNKQASVNGSTGVASPAGTVQKNFDKLGRATYTRMADGAEMTDSYTGWWQQVNTRGVNVLSPNVSYIYGRDALGRLTFVMQPPTTHADDGGQPQNPARSTYYYYDHADRLIRATSSGTDSNALNPVVQERTRYFDDFGWLLSEQTPEVPNHEVRSRDARGNPIVECTGATNSCAESYYDTSRDRISHVYDSAGRLLSSTRDTDWRVAMPPYRYDGKASFEDFEYDTCSGPDTCASLGTLNLGRSNGRLIYGVRQNMAWTANDSSFLGWFATQDLYHYNGVGGRLSFRQTNSLLLDGTPGPGSSSGSYAVTTGPTKTSVNTAMMQYFRSVGRTAASPQLALPTATADPKKPAPHVTTGRAALDAWAPHGWFRWSFGYDGAGRLSSLTYPRRDEGQATSVSYSYDRGWLTNASVSFRDPFNPTGSGSVSLIYGPSGDNTQTDVYSSGSKVFKLLTPDDASGIARPTQFRVFRTPSDLAWEFADYSYDGSGNVLSFAGNLYGYDARSRLTVDIMGSQVEYRRYDDFGNLTLQTVPWRTFNPDRSTNRHSQPIQDPFYREYDPARGQLKYDATSYVGRDFYPDGGVMTEYGRIAPSYGVTRDISVYLLGADQERLMTFNGEDGRCDTELFRHTLRDPAGRVLTDYKADNQGACNCSSNPCIWTDRFERDYVWLGKQALAILDRQQAPRFDVLDHLGSPRHAFDGSGNPLGDRVLTPFGEDFGLAGAMPERLRFTGHERNHVTGSDGQYLAMSDYMHARNYAPTLSRFVSPDEGPGFYLFNPEDANRYSYALNNPTSLVDPDGRAAIAVPALLGGAIALTGGAIEGGFRAYTAMNSPGMKPSEARFEFFVGFVAGTTSTLAAEGAFVFGQKNPLALGAIAGAVDESMAQAIEKVFRHKPFDVKKVGLSAAVGAVSGKLVSTLPLIKPGTFAAQLFKTRPLRDLRTMPNVRAAYAQWGLSSYLSARALYYAEYERFVGHRRSLRVGDVPDGKVSVDVTMIPSH